MGLVRVVNSFLLLLPSVQMQSAMVIQISVRMSWSSSFRRAQALLGNQFLMVLHCSILLENTVSVFLQCATHLVQRLVHFDHCLSLGGIDKQHVPLEQTSLLCVKPIETSLAATGSLMLQLFLSSRDQEWLSNIPHVQLVVFQTSLDRKCLGVVFSSEMGYWPGPQYLQPSTTALLNLLPVDSIMQYVENICRMIQKVETMSTQHFDVVICEFARPLVPGHGDSDFSQHNIIELFHDSKNLLSELHSCSSMVALELHYSSPTTASAHLFANEKKLDALRCFPSMFWHIMERWFANPGLLLNIGVADTQVVTIVDKLLRQWDPGGADMSAFCSPSAYKHTLKGGRHAQYKLLLASSCALIQFGREAPQITWSLGVLENLCSSLIFVSLSLPWDPGEQNVGDSQWHRLEGKPIAKEGGMLATFSLSGPTTVHQNQRLAQLSVTRSQNKSTYSRRAGTKRSSRRITATAASSLLS